MHAPIGLTILKKKGKIQTERQTLLANIVGKYRMQHLNHSIVFLRVISYRSVRHLY